MHDQCAGRPERGGPPVDYPDIGSVVMGLQGKRQPGRARAYHQDAGRPPHETAAGRHQAAAPAAVPAAACGCSSTSSRRSPGSTM